MRRLLDPKMDFIFKKIFGSEDSSDILISFLNAVIKPKDLISEVEIKNTDLEKEHMQDKFSRLDIKATTNRKEIINIEIQLKNESNMIKRSLYYWSKIYCEQLSSGQNYNKLGRVVCINILNFKYLPNNEFHNPYRLRQIYTGEELTDLEEIHFIEIPKLKKLESADEVTDLLEAWVEFLREPESDVIRNIEMSNEEIRHAKDKLYKISMNDKEREIYEIREKALKDEVSALEGAETKGIKKGIIESIFEALEEFGEISSELKEKIENEEDIQILKSWLKFAFKSESIEEFESKID